MRAKYINKTARRRTIRPDGDDIRAMRRYRGRERSRARLIQSVAAFAVIGVVVLVYFALFRR
jgi:hypothetical protein